MGGRSSMPDLPEGTAFLVILYGPDMGRRMQLGEEPFVIGRVEPADLCIPQESVSRKHSRVFRRDGRHYIEDLGSTNGTFVNDVLVKEQVLENGVQIKIGRSILKYMAGNDVEARYHEEIYNLMMTDALTQAFNKRAFSEALPREVGRAQRYKRPLSLVLFDIDHFKKINDTYGHVAGDSVLRQLAGLVRPRIREHDVFGRVGGEEFALLLPEVDSNGARIVAEKVRQAVAGARFLIKDESFSATISLGCSTLPAQGGVADVLYEQADKALYAAKQGGRNRVVVAE
jgi:diguanylate cyclase (GGDEF)-like protein